MRRRCGFRGWEMRRVCLGDLVESDCAKGLPEHARVRPIAGLTADSRLVQPGFLFAALEGVNADGARFIPDALTRGATAILTRPGIPSPSGADGAPILLAERNPRRAFARMAARFFGPQP